MGVSRRRRVVLAPHRSERFDPVYFLLKHLQRKVSGHNQNQLFSIKSNTNSIMDQLDTLMLVKKRYKIDNTQYGAVPSISSDGRDSSDPVQRRGRQDAL